VCVVYPLAHYRGIFYLSSVILNNAMQLSNRQVTGFVNGGLKYCSVVDGIMQDSNQHVLGGV
jgi:hypothetical protein